MATIVTFVILAAAAAVLWWLLRDAFGGESGPAARRCPVCGARRTEVLRERTRCIACGAEFRGRSRRQLPEPTLTELSVVVLASTAVLLFALCDVVLAWRLLGRARAGLVAVAAGGAFTAAVCSFLKHRRQYGRN